MYKLLTSLQKKVKEFGIDVNNMFVFWDVSLITFQILQYIQYNSLQIVNIFLIVINRMPLECKRAD